MTKTIGLVVVRGGVAEAYGPDHVDIRVVDCDSLEAGADPVVLPAGVGFGELCEAAGLRTCEHPGTSCQECGRPMFITAAGIAHHTSMRNTPTGIDHDRDADHVAVAERLPPDVVFIEQEPAP